MSRRSSSPSGELLGTATSSSFTQAYYTANSYYSIAFIFNHLSEPSLKEFKRQFSLNIKINFYFVKKRLNIFSFNLDTRIHTSPKEDGHGSQALGPKGVVFRRKDRRGRTLFGIQLLET